MMVLIALVNIQLLLTTVLLLIYCVQSSEKRVEVGTSNEMKKTDRSYMPICRYVCNRTNIH